MRRSVILVAVGAMLIALGLATFAARGLWAGDGAWRLAIGPAAFGAITGGAWLIAHARWSREEENGEEESGEEA